LPQRSQLVHQLGSGACPDIRRSNKPYATTISSRSVFPESMHPSKPNSVEPPWYGPVCPVVWEGWRREASPYPDQSTSTGHSRSRCICRNRAEKRAYAGGPGKDRSWRASRRSMRARNGPHRPKRTSVVRSKTQTLSLLIHPLNRPNLRRLLRACSCRRCRSRSPRRYLKLILRHHARWVRSWRRDGQLAIEHFHPKRAARREFPIKPPKSRRTTSPACSWRRPVPTILRERPCARLQRNQRTRAHEPCDADRGG
jgi:hypothetical protein